MPAPKDFAEAAKMAEWLARSSLVPEGYRGKPADLLIVADFGRRLGLPLLTALQGVAVIQGKPTVWGDCQLAICRRHPAFRGLHVEVTGEGDAMTAVATVRREGELPTVRSYSMAAARRAKLTTKGPWVSYPDRMLTMRARSWALRDAFADALMGIGSAEELSDVGGGTVPIERIVDADELALPSGRTCVDCGEPVTSPSPRAQRCDRHLNRKSARRGGAGGPATEILPPPLPDEPTPEPEPADFEARMRAATTEDDLVAIGRDAGASGATEPDLVRLRRVFHDCVAQLRRRAAAPAEPWAPPGDGLEALRARQAERAG